MTFYFISLVTFNHVQLRFGSWRNRCADCRRWAI